MARKSLEAMALGTELLVCLAVGWGGGSWVDHRLDTAPFGAISGLAVGVGAAVRGIVRVVRDYQGEGEDDGTSDDSGSGSRSP
jgi:F0F1-type ATP synthase assembly protein I